MPTLTCQRCGASFEPDPRLTERYPGWEPPLCGRCWRSRSRGGGAGGAAPQRRGAPEGRPAGDPDTGVFTDGAASPNPGPGGWGAVYVVDGEVVAEARGHEPDTTNNRMELTALLRALDLVPEDTPATIYTDSQLCYRTITEWAAGWERRGWRRKTGPIKNLDLVRELYERLRARPELELAWLPAHAGHRWNEYADALATSYRDDG